MSSDAILPANFNISDSAKGEIASLRLLWEAHAKEESDVIMIGWGEYSLDDGRQFGDVIVSFYTKDQRTDIADHIQIVDDLEIVFFTIEKYYGNFAGKTLVFQEGRFRLV